MSFCEVVIPKQENILRIAISNDYFHEEHIANKVTFKYFGDVYGLSADARIYTDHGNEFVVILDDVTKKSTTADLRVILLPQDQDTIDAMNGPKKLFTADQVEAREAQRAAELASTKEALEKAVRTAQLAATKEVDILKHDFRLVEHKGKPFNTTISRDDKFTYVDYDSQEAPALYEVLDGKLSQVSAPLVGKKFTVPKIVDTLVLKIGKSYEKWQRISS